jgi:predicted RNA-binding Zn ribbon-like protein
MVDVSTSAPFLGEPWPVELMNTIWADREGVHDALDDPLDARAWLDQAVAALDGAGAARHADERADQRADGNESADAIALRRLRPLRDALRRLAADATTDPRTAGTSPTGTDAALEHLNTIAGTAPSWTALVETPDGELTRVPRSASPPPEAVVSRLAEQGIELFAGPGRQTLRACLAPGCVLYFVRQHPRREWCSAGCGNRARVARHYRRHRNA